jgi:hypothetical protein
MQIISFHVNFTEIASIDRCLAVSVVANLFWLAGIRERQLLVSRLCRNLLHGVTG